jgi:hypothetical protein
MGIAAPSAVVNGEHPEVVEFKRRVTDRLAEHGRKGGFAAAEAFKRIDDA